jgi:hypothetical protein
MTRRLLSRLLPLALALGACGPRYNLSVPRPVVEKLPYEGRIDLLEAENDLAVAVDKLDEAHAEVLRTRDALRRARERQGAAEGEERVARDEASREVARLAIVESEARVQYLRERQEVNLRVEEVEELTLRCAYARFEQSQLQAVRKAKVEGSEKLRPEDFDRQLKDCEAEAGQKKAAMKEEDKKAEKARVEWEAKKSALAKKTFDARASPYVE